VGSRSITASKNDQEQKPGEKDIDTRVYFSVDDKLKGSYKISNCYREDLHKVIRSLSSYDLSLLSGDNESEKEKLRQLFSNGSEIYFRQSPEDKLNFVRNLQQRGQRVLMIGDGLNDAGALLMSDCGISVTEDISNFSPACDAILDASAFNKLGDFLKLSKLNLNVIKTSFFISLVYNLIGLSFALKGNLSPVIAAILMPLSSVTVVGFTTAATNFLARRRRL
ncbi:MAG: HAD-IC family P-type ATPase, partial [Bacillota bacterium]